MKRGIYLLIIVFLTSCGLTAQTDTSVITLNQCIDAALNFSYIIKQAEDDANIASLEVKTARSDRYPVLSSEISGGFSNEFQLNNNYRTGSARIAADQLLWQKGQVHATMNQANSNQQVTIYALEARKKDVILAVKTAYINCVLQNKLYEIANDNATKAKLFLEYAQERYRLGAGRKSDVLKAESDLSEAEFEKNTYMNSDLRTRNELSILTGLHPSRFSNLENILHFNNADIYKKTDSVLSKAFHVYPELQIANKLEELQQYKILQANAELYPRIGINTGYNWNYNPLIQQQKGWYAFLTFRWLLFNGNRQQYRVQVERIKKDYYQIRSKEIKNQLVKEISNGLINIQEAASQIEASEHLMETTSENLEIAKAQYVAGTGSLLELTDSRISYLASQKKNIQAIAVYYVSMASLERLTGI